jgi:Mg-chelatase subunit ChlD
MNTLLQAVQRLSCKGATNIADALREAREVILKDRLVKNKELVILVTDGGDQSPAITESKLLKNAGARVVTIGVGDGVNESLLTKIASHSDYYQIRSMDKLKDIFQKISSSLRAI